MDPKMFTHLTNLDGLWLTGNVCINKDFYPKPSKETIEHELVACGEGGDKPKDQMQATLDRLENILHSMESPLKIISGPLGERDSKKDDRQSELLAELCGHLGEHNVWEKSARC
jgi:hypothetical protein